MFSSRYCQCLDEYGLKPVQLLQGNDRAVRSVHPFRKFTVNFSGKLGHHLLVVICRSRHLSRPRSEANGVMRVDVSKKGSIGSRTHCFRFRVLRNSFVEGCGESRCWDYQEVLL